MSEIENSKKHFDLTPSPHVLRMLGEINLEHWRCLAEIIDNSIDAFLSAKGLNIKLNPEVHISIPTLEKRNSRVTIIDNGPGMDPERLENAVRAGWSSHGPIGSLGIFGMGFNIATARLGTVTQVFSTRKGDKVWSGIKVDFDVLISQKHFKTPKIVRPKNDINEHGTEVSILKLKPDHLKFFNKPYNRNKINNNLARAYSSMLREDGVPTHFKLFINDKRILGRHHCTWSEERYTLTQKFGPVHSVEGIDNALPARPFCMRCWIWLGANDESCPFCESNDRLIHQERHVLGWVGLQRYLSESEYGIDFIRHGRKIEIGNKDLFFWDNEGVMEPEYPIDDPRHRGRIVGEIHIDHCRVNYIKERFDRTDPAWSEASEIIRGRGPLRPNIGGDLGFPENRSPLSKLHHTFRRNSPAQKVAGCYKKLLVVRNNDRATEMAKKFHKYESEYITDTKWYELVEEADRELLTEEVPTDEPQETEEITDQETEEETTEEGQQIPLDRIELPSLSQQYHDSETDQTWDVKAYSTNEEDPELRDNRFPWSLKRGTDGIWRYYVNIKHKIFNSATMTLMDALLSELSHTAMDWIRSNPSSDVTFASILASLRDRYAMMSTIDTIGLQARARDILNSMAQSLSKNISQDDSLGLFNSLSTSDQEGIQRKMAARSIKNPADIISKGRFLEFASATLKIRFFEENPELFFDGNFWDKPYSEIDYGREEYNNAVRSQIKRYYVGLLADAEWLDESDIGDFEGSSRERILRSMFALDLLEADIAKEEED